MKRLLLPLLAALALPTAVNAESYWLILTYGWKGLMVRWKKLRWKVLLNVKVKAGNGKIVLLKERKVGLADFTALLVNK